MGCVKKGGMWLGANKEPEAGDRRNRTSGIPAACSHENSFGLCKSMLVDTAIYSAYAPVCPAISALSISQYKRCE